MTRIRSILLCILPSRQFRRKTSRAKAYDHYATPLALAAVTDGCPVRLGPGQHYWHLSCSTTLLARVCLSTP